MRKFCLCSEPDWCFRVSTYWMSDAEMLKWLEDREQYRAERAGGSDAI